MKKYFLFCLIAMGLLACNNNASEKQDEPAQADSVQRDTATAVTGLPDTAKTIISCDCAEIENWRAKKGYGLNAYDLDEEYAQYAHDSARLKVRRLHVYGDTIDARYKIFKNVETIMISGENVVGLDMFPKLKYLELFGAVLDLSKYQEAAWLKNIEVLTIGKSIVKNYTSFALTPKLKVLTSGHTSFTQFPYDLQNAPCLQELSLYAFGGLPGSAPVDLSQMDLLQAPCLAKFHCDTYYGIFSGMPKNVIESTVKEFFVYSKLMPNEEEMYKEIKQVKKVKR